MDTDLDPVVGNWYRRADKDQLFRVVAFDEDREVVEIQRFDGEHDEIDASLWFDLELEAAEAPEDWNGPLDGLEDEDTSRTPAVSGTDWEQDLDETDVDENDDDDDDDDEDEDEDEDDEPPEDDDDDWDGDDDDDSSDDDDNDDSDDDR